MILIRIIYAIWFLIEIRKLIDNEQSRQKAEFLAHFGAGFLVWFVSLPMIGIVASFVSQLWRFSMILGKVLNMNMLYNQFIFSFNNVFKFCCVINIGSSVLAKIVLSQVFRWLHKVSSPRLFCIVTGLRQLVFGSNIIQFLHAISVFSGHRRLGRDDSHELSDYDNFLFYDGDSDSETDFPDCEDVIRTQIWKNFIILFHLLTPCQHDPISCIFRFPVSHVSFSGNISVFYLEMTNTPTRIVQLSKLRSSISTFRIFFLFSSSKSCASRDSFEKQNKPFSTIS